MTRPRLYIMLLFTSLLMILYGNGSYHPYLVKNEYISETLRSINVHGVNIFKVRSKFLSDFSKKDIFLNASIIVPEEYEQTTLNYPAIFHIPGFGGDHTEAYSYEGRIREIEKQNPELKFIHIFLDPSCATQDGAKGGHHGFVDSENNGPWEQAFIKEFIPALKSKFRISSNPNNLFLTGHSSGGWSVVWLLLRNPNSFGGAWATSPDPLDFSDFYGVNLNIGSKDNIYKFPDGKKKFFYEDRKKNKKLDFSVVASEFVSNEWRYSKNLNYKSTKNSVAIPAELYERSNGNLNQEVLKQWSNFDLAYKISENPASYIEGLRKLKIVVGTLDNFFLDRPTRLFCEKVSKFVKNEQQLCSFIEGRDHMNLYYSSAEYADGLDVKFYREMQEKAVK